MSLDLIGNDESKSLTGFPAPYSPDLQEDVWTAEPFRYIVVLSLVFFPVSLCILLAMMIASPLRAFLPRNLLTCRKMLGLQSLSIF